MSEDNATVTVRIIKSFEYKNFRNLVFHNVDLHKVTLTQLKDMVCQRIRETASLKQYEQCIPHFDTFKMYYQPHGAKTNNPMINVGGDEFLVLQNYDAPIFSLGFRHETEVSYFCKNDYENYRLNPTTKW